jgi:hypothetical protein
MNIKEFMETITNKNGEMTNSMLVIRTTNSIAKIYFGKDTKPKVQELQQLVGGYIEPVYIPLLEEQGEYFAIVDEDGINRRKILNRIMFDLFGVQLYGDVIIMNKGDLQ